jgi:hypothetical protein
MHLVIFGLTISSSWGNGHATLWRGLVRAMVERGHTVTFYERDVPYYANARDHWAPPRGAALLLYGSLEEIRERARREADEADLALCTSFCPDGPAAARLILDSRAAIKAFYDLDTPVTLDALRGGERAAYLPAEGLGEFDLVLSFTGGHALTELQTRLGGRWRRCTAGWIRRRTSRSRPWKNFAASSRTWGPMRRTGKGRSKSCFWNRRGGGRRRGSSLRERSIQRVFRGRGTWRIRLILSRGYIRRSCARRGPRSTLRAE